MEWVVSFWTFGSRIDDHQATWRSAVMNFYQAIAGRSRSNLRLHARIRQPHQAGGIWKSAWCAVLVCVGQEALGGPREGSGGAVRLAMCTAAMGYRTCSNSKALLKKASKRDGKTNEAAHSGQFILAVAFNLPPSPSISTIFMAPPATQMT